MARTAVTTCMRKPQSAGVVCARLGVYGFGELWYTNRSCSTQVSPCPSVHSRNHQRSAGMASCATVQEPPQATTLLRGGFMSHPSPTISLLHKFLTVALLPQPAAAPLACRAAQPATQQQVNPHRQANVVRARVRWG